MHRAFIFSTMISAVMLLCSCDPIIAEVGEACLTTADCKDDAVCFERVGSTAVCMLGCEEGTRLCEGGQVCVSDTLNNRVCYEGGMVEVGAACTLTGECVRGAVCLSAGTCQIACDTRAPACGGETMCIALYGESDPRGYCGTQM